MSRELKDRYKWVLQHPDKGYVLGYMECEERGRVPVFTDAPEKRHKLGYMYAVRFYTEEEASREIELLKQCCADGSLEGVYARSVQDNIL